MVGQQGPDGVPSVPHAPAGGPGQASAPPVAPGRSPYGAPAPRVGSGGAGAPGGSGRPPWAPPVGAPGTGPIDGSAPETPGWAMPEIAKPPLDGASVAAVVTGAVGLGPVAVALGAVGLRRTTREWRRSPRIAGVGLGLGVVGTLVWLAVGVASVSGAFSSPSADPIPGDVSEPVAVHSSALAVGNCVEALPPQQEVGEVNLVPCAQAHVAEVVGAAVLDGDAYPGPQTALSTGEELCAPIFDGLALDEPSGVMRWWIVPTPDAWNEGVRTVICLTREPSAIPDQG